MSVLGRTDLANVTEGQMEQHLNDPVTVQQLTDFLSSVQNKTSDVYSRSNSWRFGEELRELHPLHYLYNESDIVYIDTEKYEISELNADVVSVRNFNFPLLSKELSRADFEEKLGGSSRNDYLKVLVTENPTAEMSSEKKPDSIEFSIGFSEHPAFYRREPGEKGKTHYTDLSFALGNCLLGVLDEKQNSERESNQRVGWYHKTDFKITATIDGEPFEYEGRFDIGDGEGDLIAHIKNFYDYALSPAGESTYGKYREELLRGRDVLIPFLEQNTDVSPEDEKLFAEIMATENEWFGGIAEETALQSEKPSLVTDSELPKVAPQIAVPITAKDSQNFRISDMELGVGTPGEKYTANVNAIRTLKLIEEEGRSATQEEQDILSRYVGWGGLASCFEGTHKNNGELKNLLTKEEYTAARESTLTAFYTPPSVIEAMYMALSQMNFKTGNILEPSCGTGNFIGMLPKDMQKSKVYGVELDSISGRIAKQLYQDSDITVDGYENVNMPDSFFDVAIGNVPFGDFKVFDRRYDKNKWRIHDYFFGATLDKVRPGGIVAFITSKGTLDKKSASVRKYIAQRAELVGAIRLPDNTFKRNAGTEVTSDIIFLQKRDNVVDTVPDWVNLGTDENGIVMNNYFVEHPEMILGDMVMQSTAFGMDSACKAAEDFDLSESLKNAVKNLQAEIGTGKVLSEMDEVIEDSIPAYSKVRNHSYTVMDGKLYFRENSVMYPVKATEITESRIRGMIQIRDSVRKLIEVQMGNYPDEVIKEEQKRLTKLYDSFIAKHGHFNVRSNKKAFENDASYYLLCSLEKFDEENNYIGKADMFEKRTIQNYSPATSVETAAEALAVSIAEKACVDIEYMKKLSGKTEHELIHELKGVIFRDIQAGYDTDIEKLPFVTADEYLSGNVREKLKTAKVLYEILPEELRQEIRVNIDSMERALPPDLTASEIQVRIGAPWVPEEIYQKFMEETFSTGIFVKNKIQVRYSKYTGEWNISGKQMDNSNIKVKTTYGTKRINAYSIFEQTLNLKDARIYDIVIEDGKEKRVLNKKETAIAQERQEKIKSSFKDWIWQDIDRREMLCKLYNEKLNNTRPREYDGKHIVFHGMNPEIELRTHQKNAIARGMYGGNTLLAHEVGSGKTFEIIAMAMEMKYLGICNKSLIAVPNHLTEQWAAEWLRLYPAANILVTTKKDFEKNNRKKLCSRIATGDYDAVIIGHSQLGKIPISLERQEDMLYKQIEDLENSISEAKRSNSEHYSIKQMEKKMKGIEVKLEKLNDRSKKDDVITFEELGVDRLFIDESHEFKNLFFVTKMRNVGGIAQTESQKASDLFMKCRYLDEITGGKGNIFATGTPISNSMVEMYTVQRYLQYDKLLESDMEFFDEWAATFGETVTTLELAPEGTGYRAKTRFAKFYNHPELMAMFKETADIQTADMLKLPVPKVNYHVEVCESSELQKEAIASLAERADAVRNRLVDPSEDNMLRITNDGRKIALDMRLINPMLPDYENSKVSVCAGNVHRIWEESADKRSAQLVFCDLSTPKNVSSRGSKDISANTGFSNVYEDLKKKLVSRGIPEDEIAYIHEAKTDMQKKELFAKVRKGTVRVLIGSTQKMGAGTNVQDKLIALHDLDCPWRPSDLTQRRGRIERIGNENEEVELFRYVTEGTFDSYMYQLIENKQRFISQVMTSKISVREVEDIDEAALSYAEIKALASGNPMIIEKCNLELDVAKLQTLKASYKEQKYALEELVLREYPSKTANLTERICKLKEDMEVVNRYPRQSDKSFKMTIFDEVYTDKETAGKNIIEACKSLFSLSQENRLELGAYRGFSMILAYNQHTSEYKMILKGALQHTVTLSADIYGNITRIDNALDGISKKTDKSIAALEDTKVQCKNAQEELKKPFAKEAELQEKTQRLKEVNIALSLNDDKDSEEKSMKNKFLSAKETAEKRNQKGGGETICQNTTSRKKEI